jgi:hypothetical protein
LYILTLFCKGVKIFFRYIFNIMPKRYHCEYKTCTCDKFALHWNSLCFCCGHAKIWHARTSKPPTDEYLLFVSSRPPARRPIYEKKNIIVQVFLPSVPPLPESDDELIYCEAVEVLPV